MNKYLSRIRVSFLKCNTIIVHKVVTWLNFNVWVCDNNHFSFAILNLLVHLIQLSSREFNGIELEILIILRV